MSRTKHGLKLLGIAGAVNTSLGSGVIARPTGLAWLIHLLLLAFLGTATCEGLAIDIEDCCLPYFAVQTAQCDRCNDAKTTDCK